MSRFGKVRMDGVIARGIAMSMLPDGRDLLAAEAKLERVRLYAETAGLPPGRADEVLGEVIAEAAATSPVVVPVPVLARRALQRLADEALSGEPTTEPGPPR